MMRTFGLGLVLCLAACSSCGDDAVAPPDAATIVVHRPGPPPIACVVGWHASPDGKSCIKNADAGI